MPYSASIFIKVTTDLLFKFSINFSTKIGLFTLCLNPGYQHSDPTFNHLPCKTMQMFTLFYSHRNTDIIIIIITTTTVHFPQVMFKFNTSVLGILKTLHLHPIFSFYLV